MTMKQFENLLDWQLKHGPHEFPGPDGGTCVNEAAIVVAGFSYREVLSIADLPESFCPVISQFSLTLNDAMPEGDTLNRLRPFAARLSGSSDSRETAFERAAYLAMCAARDFVPLALAAIEPGAAERLRQAPTPKAALDELETLSQTSWPVHVAEAVGAAGRAVARVIEAKQAIYTAELAAICAARSAVADERAWEAAVDALEGALSIGRQADPIEISLVDRRAAAVLANA